MNSSYLIETDEIIFHDNSGKIYRISKEEQDTLYKEHRLYKENNRELSLNDLAKTFPEAKGYIKKAMKEEQKKLYELTKYEQEIKNIISDKVHYSNREMVEMIAMGVYVTPHKDSCESKIEKFKKILFFMEAREEAYESTSVDLEKIKQISIKDFIQFNHIGMAKCIWHNDGDPSMKYYKKTNSVYCFSCNKYASVIDVYMQLFNVDFREAIQRLNKVL